MSDVDVKKAREDLVNAKGFSISTLELFCRVNLQAENDENPGETLEKVFAHIEASAKGVFSLNNIIDACEYLITVNLRYRKIWQRILDACRCFRTIDKLLSGWENRNQ